MAKLTPGVGFSSASGKLGGITFAAGPGGQILRANGHTVRHSSALSISKRQQFLGVASAWRSLTNAQRILWDDFANEIQSSSATSTGQKLTGYLMFCRCNLSLLDAGQSQLTVPGLILKPATISWLTGALSVSGNTLSATFSKSTNDLGVNTLYATSPIPQGVRNYQSRSFRRIATGASGGTANRFSQYTTQWSWPNSSLVGQYIVIRVVDVMATGLRQPPVDQVIQIGA